MTQSFIRRLTALGTLALLCLAPKSASAYPIQNATKTVVGASQGESLTIFGSAAGGSKKGAKLQAGGLFTQATSMVLKQQTVAQGNFLFKNGETIRAYSLELNGTLKVNNDITTRIETIPPTGIVQPTNLSKYVKNSALAAQRAAWVVSNYGQGNISAKQAAAVQLAVWNIMYESGVGKKGNVTDGSSFNVGVASPTSRLANDYLFASWNGGAYKTASGVILRQGVKFNGSKDTDKGQDLLYAKGPDLLIATPEPSTLAIASLGGLGLLGYRTRRRPAKA